MVLESPDDGKIERKREKAGERRVRERERMEMEGKQEISRKWGGGGINPDKFKYIMRLKNNQTTMYIYEETRANIDKAIRYPG